MFLQVIIGRVADLGDLQASLRRWRTDLAPGAIGWLGSTAGMVGDDIFVSLARFETLEAARRNSDQPEQHQWWMETAKAFHAEPHFLDCEKVTTFGDGPSAEAGFVQVILAHGASFERLNAMMVPQEAAIMAHRPEILGGISGATAEGQLIDAIFFTDEASARAGEATPMPAEVQALMQQYERLVTIDSYLDLTEPRHALPA